MRLELPSLDFIAGLIVGEGCFTKFTQNGRVGHSFQLKMHAKEMPLFTQIKEKLGLREKIHEYTHQKRHYVLLQVRSNETLVKKIIPAFDGRLFGYKELQFEAWRTSLVGSILKSKYKRLLINYL